jgi:hypothetical protein
MGLAVSPTSIALRLLTHQSLLEFEGSLRLGSNGISSSYVMGPWQLKGVHTYLLTQRFTSLTFL